MKTGRPFSFAIFETSCPCALGLQPVAARIDDDHLLRGPENEGAGAHKAGLMDYRVYIDGERSRYMGPRPGLHLN